MDQLIEQGSLTAFLGRGSSFHIACKDAYDRRPPQPFRMWIQHGPLLIGPSDLENTRARIYNTDQILDLPEEDSLHALRPFAQAWKNALQQLTYALVRPMFYDIRTHGMLPAILHEDIILLIKDLQLELPGTIRKAPNNNTDRLFIHYEMWIGSTTFDPDTFNDPAFASAVEVAGSVFNVDGRATAAFMGDHIIQLWLYLDASHQIRLFGEPGDDAGPLFADNMIQ